MAGAGARWSAVAVLLAVSGGLALAGGTAAAWVSTEVARDVGGVAVTDVSTTSGLELAAPALPLGLAAMLVGLGLLLARGVTRRGLAAALVVVGLAAIAVVATGMARAPAGEPAGGVVAAAAGAVAVTVAGGLALRRAPPPRLPPPYDLEGRPDDEWSLASAEEEREPGS